MHHAGRALVQRASRVLGQTTTANRSSRVRTQINVRLYGNLGRFNQTLLTLGVRVGRLRNCKEPAGIRVNSRVTFHAYLEYTGRTGDLQGLQRERFIVNVRRTLTLGLFTRFISRNLRTTANSSLRGHIPTRQRQDTLRPRIQFTVGRRTITLGRLTNHNHRPTRTVSFRNSVLRIITRHSMNQTNTANVSLHSLTNSPHKQPSFRNAMRLLTRRACQPQVLHTNFDNTYERLVSETELVQRVSNTLVEHRDTLAQLGTDQNR